MTGALSSLAASLPSVADTYDKNNVNPGTLGFVVVALIAVALFFLLRSMSRHLGKVDFEEKPIDRDTPERREEKVPEAPPRD